MADRVLLPVLMTWAAVATCQFSSQNITGKNLSKFPSSLTAEHKLFAASDIQHFVQQLPMANSDQQYKHYPNKNIEILRNDSHNTDNIKSRPEYEVDNRKSGYANGKPVIELPDAQQPPPFSTMHHSVSESGIPGISSDNKISNRIPRRKNKRSRLLGVELNGDENLLGNEDPHALQVQKKPASLLKNGTSLRPKSKVAKNIEGHLTNPARNKSNVIVYKRSNDEDHVRFSASFINAPNNRQKVKSDQNQDLDVVNTSNHRNKGPKIVQNLIENISYNKDSKEIDKEADKRNETQEQIELIPVTVPDLNSKLSYLEAIQQSQLLRAQSRMGVKQSSVITLKPENSEDLITNFVAPSLELLPPKPRISPQSEKFAYRKSVEISSSGESKISLPTDRKNSDFDSKNESPLSKAIHSEEANRPNILHESQSSLKMKQLPFKTQPPVLHDSQNSLITKHSPLKSQPNVLHESQNSLKMKETPLKTQPHVLHESQSSLTMKQPPLKTQPHVLHKSQNSLKMKQPPLKTRPHVLHESQSSLKMKQPPLKTRPHVLHESQSSIKMKQPPLKTRPHVLHESQSSIKMNQPPLKTRPHVLHESKNSLKMNQPPLKTRLRVLHESQNSLKKLHRPPMMQQPDLASPQIPAKLSTVHQFPAISDTGGQKAQGSQQAVSNGQQINKVSKKPLEVSATTKRKKKGKGKSSKKSHKSSHKDKKGHKLREGHKKGNEHKEIEEGHHRKKHKQDHHSKGGENEDSKHNEEHHDGHHKKGKLGKKGHEKGSQSHHHKGHKDNGFKAVHHKKEFMIHKKHYKDVDDKEYHGDHDHFDKFFEKFKKGIFEGGAFEGDKHHKKNQKEGHHKKGRHQHHNIGLDKDKIDEGEHVHHSEYEHDEGEHETHHSDDEGH